MISTQLLKCFSVAIGLTIACHCSSAMAQKNLLNKAGYPTQVEHLDNEITITSRTVTDTYIFRGDRGFNYRIPDTKITTSGLWKRTSHHRVDSKSSGPESVTYGQSVNVSHAVAHEASVGLSASATINAAPLGMGAEFTVEASVGYAKTLSKQNDRGSSITQEKKVPPGSSIDVWTRCVRIEAEFDPTGYSLEKFKEEILWPSLAYNFFPGERPDQRLELFNSSGELKRVYERLVPTLYDEFRSRSRESHYVLPFDEVHISEYKH